MSKKQCGGLWQLPHKARGALVRCTERAAVLLVTDKGRSRLCPHCAKRRQEEHGGEILDRHDPGTREAYAALVVRRSLLSPDP